MMGKIFYLMGKSASGKDTIYKRIKEEAKSLKEIVIYTTRPMREGEQEGREYHFVSEEEFRSLLATGKVIEHREYQTVHGPWIYFTVDDGQFDGEEDFLAIGTLESYVKLKEYFGKEKLVPIYIEVEDGLRLTRALSREREQREPKYKELCRRFLADAEDFSEEKLAHAEIETRYENIDIEMCLQEILLGIQGKV